jgi:hypothetical protein
MAAALETAGNVNAEAMTTKTQAIKAPVIGVSLRDRIAVFVSRVARHHAATSLSFAGGTHFQCVKRVVRIVWRAFTA